ncbi:MAG: hypothetical protein HY976_01130, partial [Candidatus Kerfeldbacteria bacterium]|nr:hypothetical protein [Candidatus Kerfeldbacteria bacterium]
NGPFYTDPNGYAMVNYPGVGWVGRDGQCRFYVNLVLFRSEAYWDHDRTLWPYSTYRDDYVSKRMAMTKPIGDVMEGDVIQSTWPKLHTAIVVKIMAYNSQGKVTSVDVVDCNFVGPEIVGRHIINTSGSGVGDLDNYIALKLNYI